MSTLVTLVVFLIVLSVLVLVHELGHFAVGRWVKARIEEFAIGFPPRVWSVRRGETDYSINAIPLGGYVRFAGEENPDVPGGLSSLPRLQRSAVLVAGVTMNFLLAIVLFALVYMTGYPTAVPTGDVRLASVVAGTPAEQAGLQSGDKVVSVDGQAIGGTEQFSKYITSHAGQAVAITVRRANGSEQTVQVTPRVSPPAGQGALGVVMELDYTMTKQTYPIGESLVKGVQQTWQVVALTAALPGMVARGQVSAEAARPSGPLGIARIVGGATEAVPTNGLTPLIQLTALLSVSLGLVNILPFPGLDGGRLLFVFIEWLRGGKRINPQREAIFHLTGILLLIGLMIVMTYYDIINPMPAINWGP